MKRIIAGLGVAIVLAGCASSGQHAPVVERGTVLKKSADRSSPSQKKDAASPRVHIVQRGDTLYGIAFSYGLDPRELAEQNNIQDMNLIQVGQQINLQPGSVRPVVDSRPVPAQSLIREQPRVVKYPYSDTAVAQAEAVQSAERPVVAKADIRPKPDARVEPKPDSRVESVAEGDDMLEWSMPTQGRVIGGFSESDNRKGVDFAGKLGQPVFASAPGKVVYSGSGLRGYGKLLIIKHNKTYLSAYAHNDQLLVKEGESVTRGQKIAEMGNSDSDQVKLHFEVRKLGKPVDPANYLSLGKP
jgi:lipoprotein NlpD